MLTRTSSIDTSTIALTNSIVDMPKVSNDVNLASVAMPANYDPNQSFVTDALKNSATALIRAGAGITQTFVRNDAGFKTKPSNFSASSLNGSIEPLAWINIRPNRLSPGIPILTYMTTAAAGARYASGGSFDDSNRDYNSNSRAVVVRKYNRSTGAVDKFLVHRGNSVLPIYFRRDACMANNPRSGFLRLQYVGYPELYAMGNYYSDQYGIHYLGEPSNSIQWPNNSPLPPGCRYAEEFDQFKPSGVHIDTSGSPIAAAAGRANEFDVLQREDVGLILRPNIKPNGGLINYERIGSDGNMIPNCLDQDTYWTGTVLEPLTWDDPQWELYVDKDKLAIWLNEHPDAKIRSNS